MYNKNLKIVTLVIVLCFGFFFAKVYQPAGKTKHIYQNALKDYDNGNFSNSYYLFSKVGYLSQIKPVALYHQALCAHVLGDKTSELKSYKRIIKYYPTSRLAPEAKYQAGQILVDKNPNKALKYFKDVLKSNLEDDYKTASDYYIARIESNKIKGTPTEKQKETIEKAFRDYLEKAPDGRLATNVATNWKNFNNDLSPQDALLVARAYYIGGMYKEAENIFPKTDIKSSWALQATNSYKLNELGKTKSLTENGVAKFLDTTDREDLKLAVFDYLKVFEGDKKYTYTSKLFSIAKGKNKDFLWNLKCETSPLDEKKVCFSSFYANYPSGEYAENALLQNFELALAQRNYSEAKILAQDFLNKFPDSGNCAEMTFWLGKIAQKYSKQTEAQNYFQNVVSKFPDSYYAYRAYWILKGINNATIKTSLEVKPVVYPYKYPAKGTLTHCLLAVNDYDMLAKFTKDDFIKSWIEYKKGNYSQSMLIARDAMEKLKDKPVKDDLRWRLVYPLNFYIQVHKFASQYENNDALIEAIIREESYFNPDAQSGVGAIGLMQLMPTTAHDIGNKYGINFNTSYLFNPELNIQLGNLYYSTLRETFGGKDISAISAYNGGIGSVSGWRINLNYTDTDEFVEQIPYEETKNYVKKVFRSYWNYVKIYQQN
jgi:soluble lytic murein transglycosylase-like protein